MSATATRPVPFRQVKRGGAPDWIAGPHMDGPINHRPRVTREPLPHVLWLDEPRRLLGQRGPYVLGVMSDAPLALRAAWGVADRAPAEALGYATPIGLR
jgi:hypothetical protein